MLFAYALVPKGLQSSASSLYFSDLMTQGIDRFFVSTHVGVGARQQVATLFAQLLGDSRQSVFYPFKLPVSNEGAFLRLRFLPAP